MDKFIEYGLNCWCGIYATNFRPPNNVQKRIIK